MELYARVNILDGRSVRLRRGDVHEAIPLDNDPIGRAKSWAAQGADRIHVVDLDAASAGDYRNRPLIDRLISQIEVPVQVAGGVRSHVEAARLIEAGAWRVVMGTAAIEDQNMVWDLCRDYPERIAVSIDVRPDHEIATRGWTQNSGRYLEEVLVEMSSAGVAAFLVAEAARDALVDPPSYELFIEALRIVHEPVISAGGVRNLDDLRKLMILRADGRKLAGVVVGREVTHGRFTIEEARKVIAQGVAATEEGAIPEPAAPDRVQRETAAAYEGLAAELEQAAAHARVAAQHYLEDAVGRGAAHGLSVAGHLRRAQDLLDDLARGHAERSQPAP